MEINPNTDNLPIFEIAEEFKAVMRDRGVAVVTAPTGSGKSTKIPRFLLEILPADSGQILVVQPRRIAARMLAERVAWEMGEKAGETVGYLTKYEKAVSASTRIVFLTEGILTRRLAAEPGLPGVAAIIFDEFHERTVNSDITLAMACESRRKIRPELKIVVMSATLEARPLQEYLENCPCLQSDGRLFPVAVKYAASAGQGASAKAVAQAVRGVLEREPDGDVLVFLPGAGEIYRCAQECRQLLSGVILCTLYGEMQPEDQRKVMEPAPEGKRKVILATNIAQTSLTIPGIRHIVDSGLVRQNCYDSLRALNRLDVVPIARDAADQRAGRAGREAPGTCLRLWTQLEQNAKPAMTIPEIRRVDLAEAVLALKSYGYEDLNDFPWFEKPPQNARQEAEKLLDSLGLLDPSGALSALGRDVRRFPVHPRLALLLHRGMEAGCPRQAAYAAAMLSERPLLTASSAERSQLTELRQETKRTEKHLPASDFLALLRLQQKAVQAHFDRQVCERLGINSGAAREVERSVQNIMAYLKGSRELEPAESDEAFLKVLLQTFPDRIARRRHDGNLRAELSGRRLVEISPLSLVRDEEYFLSAEMREVAVPGTQSFRTQLSLNSGFPEEWLWELFPDDFEESDEAFFDERKQQVFRRRLLSCRGLILDETISNDPDLDQAAEILAAEINAHSWHLQGWDESVEHWLNRLAWLRTQCPQLGLPDCSERSAVVKAICRGETSYRVVRQKPCLPALKAMLSSEQQRQVEHLAPVALPLPNGRKLKIEYFPDHPPRGRARIQDLYDVKGPLCIVNGSVPVLLDILAPNMRTVQITDDLKRFWEVHYPALKSALARRYPKHEWR